MGWAIDWTSVKDGLPADGETVLVKTSREAFTAEWSDGQFYAVVSHLDSGCQNPVYQDYRQGDITHWTSLHRLLNQKEGEG